jgi:hypothetical protein
MALCQLQFHLEPAISIPHLGRYIELFRFEDFGTSLYGTEDCAGKSHSHVGSVSLIQTPIEI